MGIRDTDYNQLGTDLRSQRLVSLLSTSVQQPLHISLRQAAFVDQLQLPVRFNMPLNHVHAIYVSLRNQGI